MSHLLFRLRNVPDDEAEEVRALLERHRIEFYETSGGLWGISMPGLWVGDERELVRARELIDGYQQQRTVRMRQARNDDAPPSLIARVREQPFFVIGIIGFCLFVLYAMLMPFIRLAMA